MISLFFHSLGRIFLCDAQNNKQTPHSVFFVFNNILWIEIEQFQSVRLENYLSSCVYVWCELFKTPFGPYVHSLASGIIRCWLSTYLDFHLMDASSFDCLEKDQISSTSKWTCEVLPVQDLFFHHFQVTVNRIIFFSISIYFQGHCESRRTE